MWLDDLVSNARVVGERGQDDGLVAVSASPLVEHVSDGLGAEGASLVRVVDGDVEGSRAVLIEEAQETRGRASEMSTVERDLPKERPGCGTDGEEAILPTVLPRLPFLGRECGEMPLLLDLLACVVRASVTSNLDRTVEHAHDGIRRDDREWLAHVRMRDRVVVSVEADIGCLPRRDDAHEIGRRRVLGQREETRSFLDEGITDEATIGVGGDGPAALHPNDPGVELGVEVVDGVERPRGEEGFAEITHPPLDATLLIAARYGARLWREVVVTGKVEDPGMESNEVSLTLEHGALQVVVKDGARDTSEGVEGGEVAPEEALGGLVEVEAGEECATPRQHHQEAGEGTSGATDHDPAERRPVHLGLLARQDRQSEERLMRCRAYASDEATYREDPAGVSALTQHLEEPRGTQTGIPLDRREDKVAIGIEHLRAQTKRGREERPTLDGVMDGVAVNAQLGGDGADLPVLGEEEPPDRGTLLVRDHRATSSMRSFLRSSNFPMPKMSRRRTRRPCSRAGTQSSV